MDRDGSGKSIKLPMGDSKLFTLRFVRPMPNDTITLDLYSDHDEVEQDKVAFAPYTCTGDDTAPFNIKALDASSGHTSVQFSKIQMSKNNFSLVVPTAFGQASGENTTVTMQFYIWRDDTTIKSAFLHPNVSGQTQVYGSFGPNASTLLQNDQANLFNF